MSNKPEVCKYKTLHDLVIRLRDDLNNRDFVLLYAYNGTGKTRISMEFKERGKKQGGIERDTLYFNAYTEDLFHWDNDLENDAERHLKMNANSRFFSGFKALALEEKIFVYLQRYADFDFKIDYEQWTNIFSRGVTSHIKISRGEENIFVWCIFLALCELIIDGAETYDWVKYLYIDDPISSLDDNNAIAVAIDLAQLLKKGKDKLKTVISSHHSLFFNVMCNELKKLRHKQYFLHRASNSDSYTLRPTKDTPFFHHVAMLHELKQASESGSLYTYHFNMLRSLLEKTASFHGFNNFSACIQKDANDPDGIVHARLINVVSHGNYSLFEPAEMLPENKKYFRKILHGFMGNYQFNPDIFPKETTQASHP